MPTISDYHQALLVKCPNSFLYINTEKLAAWLAVEPANVAGIIRSLRNANILRFDGLTKHGVERFAIAPLVDSGDPFAAYSSDVSPFDAKPQALDAAVQQYRQKGYQIKQWEADRLLPKEGEEGFAGYRAVFVDSQGNFLGISPTPSVERERPADSWGGPEPKVIRDREILGPWNGVDPFHEDFVPVDQR